MKYLKSKSAVVKKNLSESFESFSQLELDCDCSKPEIEMQDCSASEASF